MVFMKNLSTFPVIPFNLLLSPTRPFFNYYQTCFTYITMEGQKGPLATSQMDGIKVS